MTKYISSILLSGLMVSATFAADTRIFKAIEADDSAALRSTLSELVQDFGGVETLQQRLGKLNALTFEYATSTENAQFVFELFDGLTATGKVSKVIHHDEAGITLVGQINDDASTTFIITKTGDDCTGLFHFNDGSEVEFDTFATADPATILLREVDTTVRRSCGVDDSALTALSAERLDELTHQPFSLLQPAAIGGITEVDVVVFVSEDTFEDLGKNMNTVRNRFRAALALSNTRLSNSKVDMKINDVAYHRLSLKTDGVNSGTLLDRFSAAGTVSAKLESEKADLAVLMSSSQSMPDAAGIAYVYEPGYGKDDSVFTVVSVNQLNYALTHEFGHLFGCLHNRAASSGTPPFSYGYGFINSEYATQMSYENNQQLLNYFSSPLLTYRGTVLGSANTDNARVLRNTKDIIAGFRTRASPREIVSVEIIGPDSLNSEGSGSYRLKVNYDSGDPAYPSTGINWSEDSIFTSINSSGVVDVSTLSAASTFSVSAEYSGYSVSINVNLNPEVIVKTPVRLAIYGKARILERDAASYQAYIIYDDGTRKRYTEQCAWIDRSPHWTVSRRGRVVTSAVSTHALETLKASITLGEKRFTALKNIIVLDRIEAKNKPPQVRNRKTYYQLSGNENSFKNYRFFAPRGSQKMIIKIFGGDGDADLKIRHARLANSATYNYKSESYSNTETIILNNPKSGYWYIGIEGFEAYRNLRMKCEFRR